MLRIEGFLFTLKSNQLFQVESDRARQSAELRLLLLSSSIGKPDTVKTGRHRTPGSISAKAGISRLHSAASCKQLSRAATSESCSLVAAVPAQIHPIPATRPRDRTFAKRRLQSLNPHGKAFANGPDRNSIWLTSDLPRPPGLQSCDWDENKFSSLRIKSSR